MYFAVGRPKPLGQVRALSPNVSDLKKQFQIAVIDDNPFSKAETLRSHNFQLAELGDIRRVDQVAEYPIVVCDIRGVGSAFDSPLEGAHVMAEIRKAYPDKFLIAYSAAESDMNYNEALRSVDISVPKDSQVAIWVAALEKGLGEVGDPLRRWLRFRTHLSMRGFDAYEIFRLEQKYIEALEKKDASIMGSIVASPEVKRLAIEFSKIALTQIFKVMVTGTPSP